MKPIRAERTPHTPEVIFDATKNLLSLEGECYPENPVLFFNPILAALQMHLRSAAPASFRLRVRLSYANSASTKSLRQLFMLLNDAAKAGCSVDVEWEYDQDDDAIQDLGEDLMYGLGIPYLRFHEVPFVA